MRYSLLIEYDGSDYSGWQIQKMQKTVQGEIEKALEVILKIKTGIIGAGFRVRFSLRAISTVIKWSCAC